MSQWYDDEQAMAAAEASPETAKAWEDVPRYATMTGTWWVTSGMLNTPPPHHRPPGTPTNNACIAPPSSPDGR